VMAFRGRHLSGPVRSGPERLKGAVSPREPGATQAGQALPSAIR
jgi:hypothetical protein